MLRKNEGSTAKFWRWIRPWALPICILLIWVIWLVAVILHGNGINIGALFGVYRSDYQTSGQFGDSFGSLSAFMASLAAAGAWRAVALSRAQAFEHTFYNLLNHLNELVSGTDIQGKKSVSDENGNRKSVNTDLYVGRDAFKRMVTSLRSTTAATKRSNEIDKTVDSYKKFYDRYKNDLAHYFRTIYQIVSFIDRSNQKEKNFYSNFLRAQLSDSEQILLMYNCSVGKGREKFKALVEKYSLLHNCSRHDDDDHWENTILRPSFRPSAFRDDETEVWPSPTDISNDIAISTT
jgi:hypothetical protein